MERRAPAVVAVVVTTGPAPLLEGTLRSLGGQDYPELSVLVLTIGDPGGVAEAVARACPSAFVRELGENRGFAAACNEVLSMVEGAAFLCFCHDDVELARDAIHLMVEEAYRSNAGVVTPKVVRMDDPRQLLHVGLNADRFGATTERVEPGEIDQGQHDTARDVFVAPGGVTLVRADLFASIGGFDPSLVVLGEDLDFCWRAQVAGSRVVLAPAALVAHAELLTNSQRPLSAVVRGAGGDSLTALARRHRLSTMLTCYRLGTLLVACALLVGLEVAECAVALAGRDRERVGAIVGSWRWNLSRPGELRRRRRALRKLRVLDDHEIRRLQVAGASRLTTFGSRLVHQGVDAARGALHHVADGEGDAHPEPLDRSVGFGAAFSDDQSFDELDDLGRRGGRLSARVLTSRSTQVALAGLVVVLFAIGVRGLISSHLPLVGRLAPLGSWTGTWHRLFAGWSPAGVGTGAAGSPGFGVLGIAGTVVVGRMGLLTRGALLLSIPVGALGTYGLLARVGSRRARVAGAIAYVFLALGPNLVAAGRLDALTAFALLPFVLTRLLRVAGVAPFAAPTTHDAPASSWRASRAGQLGLLGALEAIVVALDPSAATAVLVAAVGLVLGGMAAGERRHGALLGTAVAAFCVAAVLLAPMTVDALASGTGALGVFGAAPGSSSLPGLGGMLRLALGPYGHGVLSWLLPAAALLPLLAGRAERFAAAARFAGMGACSVLAATLVAHHALGSLTPDVATVLVPYAVAVAALVGAGVASFERDVAPARFGWRQLAATAAVCGALVGGVPFVASLSSGRFDLPQYGLDESIGAVAGGAVGGTRVLWLGDPRALPMSSWTVEPGLAFATSQGAAPSADDLFAPPAPGAASVLADDVRTALDGRTVLLGRLLASAGVGTVAVVTATAPSLAGTQQTSTVPPPADLLVALRRQLDLSARPSEGTGVAVFGVAEEHGIVATRAEPLAESTPASAASAARDWRPALAAGTWAGAAGPGTLLSSLAPAGDFVATSDGTALRWHRAFGWAASFVLGRRGFVRLQLHVAPLDAALAGVMLALWALVAIAALGADRLLRLRAAVRRDRDVAATARIARAA